MDNVSVLLQLPIIEEEFVKMEHNINLLRRQIEEGSKHFIDSMFVGWAIYEIEDNESAEAFIIDLYLNYKMPLLVFWDCDGQVYYVAIWDEMEHGMIAKSICSNEVKVNEIYAGSVRVAEIIDSRRLKFQFALHLDIDPKNLIAQYAKREADFAAILSGKL